MGVQEIFPATAGGIAGVSFDTSLADRSVVLHGIDLGDEVLIKISDGDLELYTGSNTEV